MRRFLLCGAAAAALAVPASASAGCGSAAYAYAGVESHAAVQGIHASIAPLALPEVKYGHVAGWVGINSPASDEWFQIGIVSFAGDSSSKIYIELARANQDPHYVALGSARIGKHHDFAVRELKRRPGWWQATLDGSAVGRPVYLAGSHGHWRAQVTGESWNDNSGACNLYTYSFRSVEFAFAPSGRTLSSEERIESFQDAGYRLAWSSRFDFIARSVLPSAPRAAATAPARADGSG